MQTATQTAQHTPGPWNVDMWEYPQDDRRELVIQTATNRLAVLDWDQGQDNPYTIADNEARANARLIAAAPELLAALEYLTDLAAGPPGGVTIDQKRAAMDRARAAIAKAKGGAA